MLAPCDIRRFRRRDRAPRQAPSPRCRHQDRRLELSAARARRPLARDGPLQAARHGQSHSADPETPRQAAEKRRSRSPTRLIAKTRQTGEFCGATSEENRGAIDSEVRSRRLHCPFPGSGAPQGGLQGEHAAFDFPRDEAVAKLHPLVRSRLRGPSQCRLTTLARRAAGLTRSSSRGCQSLRRSRSAKPTRVDGSPRYRQG